MILRVVADIVSPVGDLTHQFGTSTREAAHKEKCRGHPVAFEKTEELRCARWIRPIIEGERDLGGFGGMVQGGTEKLRGRGDGAPSCNSCASSCGRRSIKRPRVHARIFACEASCRKNISCKKARRDNVWRWNRVLDCDIARGDVRPNTART